MSDEEPQVDLHDDIDPSKIIPVEELLDEEAVIDEVPLLADEHDEYAQRDIIDLLEPDFMDPYEESNSNMF